MLRLVILDTIGGQSDVEAVSRAYKDHFPNVTFRDATPKPIPRASRHPHGGLCACCALACLPKSQPVEVYFIRILGAGVDAFSANPKWMDVVREIDPHGINMSVGIDHHNTPAYIRNLRRFFDPRFSRFSKKLYSLLDDTGAAMFCAAGNSDSTRRGRPDLDDDIAYPQRMVSEHPLIYVIGSCDFHGVPSPWSSDGPSVTAMYWGESVPLPDPFTAIPGMVSGTSFASPFAMGDAANRGLLNEGFWSFCRDEAVRMEGWPRDKRHPKAGYGGMLPALRGSLREDLHLTTAEMRRASTLGLAWHDLDFVTHPNVAAEALVDAIRDYEILERRSQR